MRRWIVFGFLAAAAAGCDGGGGDGDGVEPTAAMVVEPDYVRVDHILVAVKSDRMTQIKRTAAQAKALAEEIMAKLKAGEDWAKLKAAHSDDKTGAPTYPMNNDGVPKRDGDFARKDMAPAFGEVSFKLKVGELGMTEYNAQTSPFGYHIIKRTK